LKLKAILVVRGFLLKAAIDYGEVFAPVARMETIRLVVSIASLNDWKIHQMDVKSVFLNGPLEEEVFVKQSPSLLHLSLLHLHHLSSWMCDMWKK
jgi:hypothetical protein